MAIDLKWVTEQRHWRGRTISRRTKFAHHIRNELEVVLEMAPWIDVVFECNISARANQRVNNENRIKVSVIDRRRSDSERVLLQMVIHTCDGNPNSPFCIYRGNFTSWPQLQPLACFNDSEAGITHLIEFVKDWVKTYVSNYQARA